MKPCNAGFLFKSGEKQLDSIFGNRTAVFRDKKAGAIGSRYLGPDTGYVSRYLRLSFDSYRHYPFFVALSLDLEPAFGWFKIRQFRASNLTRAKPM